ncbi:SMI1/KNR4 family protein [Paraflavitalea speifideaquila]|uniref:SMI1/KNR4 family protein n=1 Tax=Paraflavitalea speifideaquila TaxID=3076558 RepID=UPI0028EBF3F2|nr:SMI1/KNR4 family protein [Paraflavitalea speifideiaquila]
MNPFASIEDKLGYPLPGSCKAFFLATDNHQYIDKICPRILQDGDTADGRIEGMVTIDSFWKYNDYCNEHFEDMQAHFESPTSYVESAHLYTIILGVNMCICMALNGLHKGKVYSVDNGDFGIIYQADSLDQFLQQLFRPTV